MGGVGKVKPPKIEATARDFTGLLDAYKTGATGLFSQTSDLLPQYGRLYQSTADALTPGAVRQQRSINPGLTGLLDKMLASAGGEGSPLDYGSPLPPKVLYMQNQMTRAGQAARGMGFGPSDVLGETRDATRLSMDMVDRNREWAGKAASLSYDTQISPVNQFISALLSASDKNLLTPANSLSLLLAPYQARLDANKATAENNTALISQGSQGFDSALGTGLGLI